MSSSCTPPPPFPFSSVSKAALLAACAALQLDCAASKNEAFAALKDHFSAPLRAAASAAYGVLQRAKAEYDDVDKEELLEACAALGLEGASSKRGAYDLLAARFEHGFAYAGGPLRGHCVAKLNHGDGNGVFALAMVEGAGLVSGGLGHIRAWAQGADRGLRSTAGKANGIVALPGGRFATAGYHTELVEVWDAGTGQRLHQLRGHTNIVICVAALPGGLLASGSWDKTVRIWNAATGAHVATLEGHTDWVYALAALPDGRLASGSGDNTIRVWNVATRACTQVLQHPHYVWALAVLDGGRLASGGRDANVYIWSTAGGVQEAVLKGHTREVSSLAALPNGLLASGSNDSTVRVWDVGARARVAVLEGHGGTVFALAALPDGRLASGSRDDPLIRVWTLTAPGTPEDAAAAAAEARGVVLAPAGAEDDDESDDDDED